MVFASATRLYVGTTTGLVFRLDKGATWTATRIDNAAGGALPLAGLITDIAVDWSDATGSTIFICFGGAGDARHVWRYDGTAWQARSGAAGSGTELLDVEHNALQYDRVTNRVFVAADIGVWQSADAGVTWTALQNGLPDAPVYDLQIYPRNARCSARSGRVGVEAGRPGAVRRRALHPRHDVGHRSRREHRWAQRPVDLPDRARLPLPEPEHKDRRSDAGGLPDADD